ncbi:MAG: recombinase RecA [Phycisphaerales bacterium]|nr:recombinase RecA [Phycisphaerales bacterium]
MTTATSNNTRKTQTADAAARQAYKVCGEVTKTTLTPTRMKVGMKGSESKARKAAMQKTDTKTDTVVEDKGRVQALERAISQIDKMFGKGAIMRLDGSGSSSIPAISTGTLSLDLALGTCGLPRGRVVEVFGPESSGKTTLALNVVAQAQKCGVAAFIDAEHALDPSWAKRLGVDVDALLVSQPDTGEQALEICEMLIRSNAVDIIVVDSVAALIPRAEIEGDMGDAHVGLQARLMSQAMRKLTGALANSDCTLVFINQLREKIGVMFGSPETTPGGRALKFYSSIRIDIRRIGSIKDGDSPIGNRVRARVVKNKVAPPFRTAEFDIMFNEGISATGDLIDLAVADDIVAKSGSWFSYGEVRLGQGRENSKQFLSDNPEVFEEIKAQVLVARGVGPEDASATETDASPSEE